MLPRIKALGLNTKLFSESLSCIFDRILWTKGFNDDRLRDLDTLAAIAFVVVQPYAVLCHRNGLPSRSATISRVSA